MSTAPWIRMIDEPELRAAVMSHAALRRRIRDRYLCEAAAALSCASPWAAAGALLVELDRRRQGEALAMALLFGPVPSTRRGLWNVLKRSGMAISAAHGK